MTENVLLGIDVGTTGTKALLIAEDGQILASASESYPLITPGIGRCEQNALDWYGAVARTVRRVCAASGQAEKVRALSLSTQGGTVVPTDAAFRPLTNAIVWNDRRCAESRSAFEDTLGADFVYRTCGWKLNNGLPAMQLRHMRLEHPDLFARAAYFLTVPDFIAAKLTGRPAVDLSNAGINQMTDVRQRRYDPRILDCAGVKERQLAPLTTSCAPIGTLTREAAEALGLPESVLVCAGAHDQYAVALGAGICEAGDAVIGTGTAWVVTALRDAPDFESGFSQSVSAAEGRWGTMLSISTGGVCLDWLRSQVLGDGESPMDYDELNELAAQRDTPGANGLRFYPYFGGAGQPEADSRLRATLLGLDLSHDRGHIVRAVMEGVACQVVWALRTLERRQPITRLFLSGGAAKSPLWTRILAEVAGRPLFVSGVADLACVGAAMMAGVGCGLYQNTMEAARRLAPKARQILPDEARVHAYQQIYDDYRRGARALRQVYEEV